MMTRNKKAVWDPEHYCPICGGRLSGGMPVHRCPPATLAAINAADTAALWPVGFAMLDGRTVM